MFYKDSSLVWRCATHLISAPGVHWIGKGDVKRIGENEYSALSNVCPHRQCRVEVKSPTAIRQIAARPLTTQDRVISRLRI